VFDSRLVIKMPSKMTYEAGTTPSIKNLDGNILKSEIAIETAYPGCDVQVCYAVTHSSLNDVPGGTTLRFNIVGTTNQESVQDAGLWGV
jgi:hypothetical protein